MPEIFHMDDEGNALIEALREARAQKKEWEEQEQRCRAALLDSIKDRGNGAEDDICFPDRLQLSYGNNVVAEIESRESTRFDRKTFAKDWPKLDEEYRTVTKSKVINIIGNNEGE